MVSDLILSVVLIVLSLVWGYIGIFRLGLWIPGVSADSGFIPTVFSVVMLVCAVIMLAQTLQKRKSGEVPADTESGEKAAGIKEQLPAFCRKYSIVLFCIGGILCLQYLGLVPMCFLLVFCWMKFMNRFSWLKSILITVIATACIYMIFDFWLKIPFPGLM